MSTVPPIITTSLTRMNASGSIATALAKFVSGPTARMVTVSGSFSRNRRSISSCAATRDGRKDGCSGMVVSAVGSASVRTAGPPFSAIPKACAYGAVGVK